METDFSFYDVLTVETGLSEEPPLELLFCLRGRTVLSSRNGEAIDSWMKAKPKKNKLIDGPKQVSTIKFTKDTIRRNVNRRA